MAENRKMKRKILPKRRNFSFEKCAKENSKTIFLPIFLSIRRATTRRVNIKIRHERESKFKQKQLSEK